jgi:NRAMP (natural resistance-associated macrophage protein)-like metal ion transporter
MLRATAQISLMSTSVNASNAARRRPGYLDWRRFAAVAGPGLVVMLADTDAGSIITAAQSGAEWGYGLLLLQLILVPILFMVQELTVRLGIVTRKGHAELIGEQFGRGWAWLSVGTLVISCIGALLSELSGLAGVGLLIGVPAPVTMVLVVAVLVLMAYRGSYLSVERIAIAVGLFELVFLAVAWRAQPGLADLAAGAIDITWRDPKYLYLVAANIGAVIMPWMVFYQQSSVVEKKLTIEDQPAARLDTAFGAVLTQVIMAAVLVATAATLSGRTQSGSLDTVQQIAEAITPFLGQVTGKLLFGLGLAGSALVATIVVTLTAARTLSEVLGVKHSLEHEPKEAPWFYGIYTATLVAGALLIVSGINLVSLSVGVQVMNALLLPIVLGFLYLLARRLPEPHRLRGGYAVIVAIVIAAAVVFGVYSGISGLWG